LKTAIQRLGLRGRYIGLAYAAYLSEPDYLAVAEELPVVLPYDVARHVFYAGMPDGDDYAAQRDNETTSAPMITQRL
jgi:hypothetical protein